MTFYDLDDILSRSCENHVERHRVPVLARQRERAVPPGHFDGFVVARVVEDDRLFDPRVVEPLDVRDEREASPIVRHQDERLLAVRTQARKRRDGRFRTSRGRHLLGEVRHDVAEDLERIIALVVFAVAVLPAPAALRTRAVEVGLCAGLSAATRFTS